MMTNNTAPKPKYSVGMLLFMLAAIGLLAVAGLPAESDARDRCSGELLEHSATAAFPMPDHIDPTEQMFVIVHYGDDVAFSFTMPPSSDSDWSAGHTPGCAERWAFVHRMPLRPAVSVTLVDAECIDATVTIVQPTSSGPPDGVGPLMPSVYTVGAVEFATCDG